jgi:hypothetical protein
MLENLELIREMGEDPEFDKALESRIIYRELLDLEFQEIDEQLERICSAGAELQSGKAQGATRS